MWPHEKLKILVPRTPPDPPLPPWHPPGVRGGQKWPKCIPSSNDESKCQKSHFRVKNFDLFFTRNVREVFLTKMPNNTSRAGKCNLKVDAGLAVMASRASDVARQPWRAQSTTTINSRVCAGPGGLIPHLPVARGFAPNLVTLDGFQFPFFCM